MDVTSSDARACFKQTRTSLARLFSALDPTPSKTMSLAVTLLTIVGAASAQPLDFYLRNGDHVVFYGDSITESLLYTTLVETFVVTRHPELEVTFVNSGWSGDRVSGGGGGRIDVRLKRDVIDHRPSVVTIMLGMNDGNVAPYDPASFNTFANGYRHIIETLKEARPNLRIMLIKPSPYDDVTRASLFEGGYNAVLVRYGDFVAELAREMKLDFADLNTSVIAALAKADSTDARIAQRIIPDRVHPHPAGHLLMAQALLSAWNAPAIVAAVEIDAVKGCITRAENTRVSDLVKDIGLSWTQIDKSLPMPLDLRDTAIALAVESGAVIENLNQQLLKVTGLAVPLYTLEIDSEEISRFTRESLSAGINLGTLPTPMLKQATAVHSLTMNRNHIQFTLWRELQIRLQGESSSVLQEARAALAALESDLHRRQRALAKTKAHRFQLVPSRTTH